MCFPRHKKAAKNVVDAINSKDLLEIELVDNNETLETETVRLGKNEISVIIGGKSYKDGDVVNITIEDYGGGRVRPPVINGNGRSSNHIVAQIAKQNITATVAGTNGNQIILPNYAVLFHEAFGHFVYHYIQNSCTQNQQTIDYENSIRQLRNLPLRSGTDHPKDKDY